MNFQQFSDELIRQLTPMFPDGTQINTEMIPKNNGVFLEALIIREPGINLSPTIYLENYFELYKEGTSMDEICHIICEFFMLPFDHIGVIIGCITRDQMHMIVEHRLACHFAVIL